MEAILIRQELRVTGEQRTCAEPREPSRSALSQFSSEHCFPFNIWEPRAGYCFLSAV
jgi:hypothetical protein